MDLCALRFFILRVLVSKKEMPPILAALMLQVPVTSSQGAEAKGKPYKRCPVCGFKYGSLSHKHQEHPCFREQYRPWLSW